MSKRWSIEDIEMLKDMWGVRKLKYIAEKLGRTETAVALKAKRLGLGSAYTSSEYLSANQVAEIVGIDRHCVGNWIKNYGLKGKKRVMRKEFAMWLIKPKDLLKWLENNQDKWNTRKLELFALGQEPQWLKEKRKIDREVPKRRFQKWTRNEDLMAIQMFKRGYTCKEIGKHLNRSTNAAERRLSRLDIWGTGEYTG